MLQVNVRFFGRVRAVTGKPSDVVKLTEGSTLKELILSLSERYGDEFRAVFFDEDGKVRKLLPVFLIAGRGTRSLDKVLEDDMTVTIMPGLAGG